MGGARRARGLTESDARWSYDGGFSNVGDDRPVTDAAQEAAHAGGAPLGLGPFWFRVWDGLPNGTKSVVLIVDDPDAPDPAAPKRVWVHWVLYNIPASVTTPSAGRPARSSPKPSPPEQGKLL